MLKLSFFIFVSILAAPNDHIGKGNTLAWSYII